MTDTMHIVFSIVTVLLFMLSIGFGAVAFGKSFRFYSIASLIILVVFGILTAMQAPDMEVNGPTPLMGVWERINIGVYICWIVVLAIILLRKESKQV